MGEIKLVQFPQDSVILREGDENYEMYKIVKGHAEVYMGYGTPLETLLGIIGEQKCFGEFGLLLKKPAIYTVVAYSDVIALRITENAMDDFIQDNHRCVLDIMKNMAGSMMTMRLQLEMLLKEIETENKENNEALQRSILQARTTMKHFAMYQTFAGNNMLTSQTPTLDKKA